MRQNDSKYRQNNRFLVLFKRKCEKKTLQDMKIFLTFAMLYNILCNYVLTANHSVLIF